MDQASEFLGMLARYGQPATWALQKNDDVDLVDLATLLAKCGTTKCASYADGDINGDGAVDLADLATLFAVYGTTCD